MYKHILVPIALEHNRDTGAAMDVAHRLLVPNGKITALHVSEALPSYVSQYLSDDQLENRYEEVLAALKAEIGGVRDVKPVVTNGHSGRSIVDYASDNEVDCIIIASHQPGMQDYFLGSTAARVVRHAHCAVHVIR